MITSFDTDNNRPTGMTCQWQMTIDDTHNIVKMGTNSNTLQCVLKTRKYVINVPNKRMVKAVNFFGRNSGKTVDKFKETQLHLEKCYSEGFGELIISESFAAIEMEVEKLIECEDKSYLIVGKVLACRVRKEFFADGKFLFTKETESDEFPLHHYGGDKFATICLV